ncbi:Zinc finger protein-likePLAGL1 [Orchesella cincta]|uniref:Zinc finger protein-likePLAGL1 n=1 Tax=Orchesella cincta TaxID=48709 RepID=A0A1D2N2R2_ORCCI|nr:Zinc finger protein-likePLAGL1 [Orchesella cincta]
MYNCQYFEDEGGGRTATYTTLSNAISPPEINAIYRGNVIVSRDQYSGSGGHFEPAARTFTDTDGIISYTTTSANSEGYDKNPQGVSDNSPVAAEAITPNSFQQTDHPEDENVPKKTETKDCNVNESVQKKSAKFICKQCIPNKGFRHKSYYDYHLRTHSGERPFQCTISSCSKGFFERSKLNRHLSSCHNINTSIYEDDIHDAKSHKCSHCQKSFSRSAGLKAHLLTHEGSRPFPCTQCDRKFSGLTALKNHEATHKGVKSILCDICGKAFLLKKYLDLHLKTTHKKEQRKHRCSRCRKEFHSAKDLKRHQLMHSNERRYLCKLCLNTSFKRRDNLHRHLKLTHSLTPEQISEESSTVMSEIATSNPPNSRNDASNQRIETPPAEPPPLNHHVSVIKYAGSTQQDVMMAILNSDYYCRNQIPKK